VLLGLWFVLQLSNIGMGGGVAWFAHIGGFLGRAVPGAAGGQETPEILLCLIRA